jgi:transcriptional repressor of cell division inhibition gene dicB
MLDMLLIAHHPTEGVHPFVLAHLLTRPDWRANNSAMTKEDAIKFFGTQAKLAEAIGMSQGSVSLWGSSPPPLRQLQIEALTAGALKAGPECDKFRVTAQAHAVPQQAA